jgi:uncharacterized delta-60 repeat protein
MKTAQTLGGASLSAFVVALMFSSHPLTALAVTESSPADGTFDTGFAVGSAANGNISWTSEDSFGNILVVGDFTEFDGVQTNRIVRLKPDGSRDSSFQVGTGLTGLGSYVETLSTGKVLVAGFFLNYQGSSALRLIRLESDGSRDSTFTAPPTNNYLRVFDVLPDGAIIAGGAFTTPSVRLMKLDADGAPDATFSTNLGTGFDDDVWTVATQSNGQILVGGQFTSFNGNNLGSRLVRLNADGTLDSTFSTNFGAAVNDRVRAIHVQSDGKILVGGRFSGGLIRLNSDGSVDAGFSTSRGSGFNSEVTDIQPGPAGQVYLSGNFTTYQGSPAVRVVRMNDDASLDSSFTTGVGPNSFTSRVLPLANGQVIISGAFTSYDGRLSTSADPKPIRIARLTSMSLTPTSQTVPVDVNQSVTTEALTAVANSTVTYSISPALPTGFSLNTSTGVVSGSSADPVPAADYTITGTDAAGRTATASLTLGMPPAPPESRTSRSGSSETGDAEIPGSSPMLAATGGLPVTVLLAGSLLAGIGLTLARRKHTPNHR